MKKHDSHGSAHTAVAVVPADSHATPGEFDLDLDGHKAKPATKVVTLDPAKVTKQEDMLSILMKAAVDVAMFYLPGRMRDSFTEVARMFAEVFIEYRRFATKTLEEALATLKAMEAPKALDINAATESLKGELRSFASKRLDAIDALKAKVAAAKAEYRRLTIGITGNPAIAPKVAEVGLASILPIVATFAVALYFEIVFNVPILQDQGNRNMAIAFAIAVSLAGTVTTFMAGKSKRAELDNRNAEREKHSCFPDGIDPETKKPAVVFPLSGDAQFHSRLWHSIMFVVIAGTLAIRYIMMTELGDIAGSFGVVLVFLVLYAWEVNFAEVTHPLAAECLAKKKEASEAEEELKNLEGSIASPETKKAFDAYTASLTTSETAARKQAEARKQAADTFRRLASEFLASTAWFADRFADALEALVKEIGKDRSETDEELAVLDKEVKPAFSVTDLPFNLNAEVEEAGKITNNVEIIGRKMTAVELDKALASITKELIEERATAARAQAAAAKTATFSTWRASRLK